MTTPALDGGGKCDREPPLRLSWFGDSPGPIEPRSRRRREFCQVGLELIGVDSPAMDAEVLAVLCRTLDACGLEDYAVSIGEATFFSGLLEVIGISEAGREAISSAIIDRDLVRLHKVVDGLDIDDDDRRAILEAAALRGGSYVLTRARELSRGPAMEESLKRLARTCYLVTRHGFAHRIIFDMGASGDIDHGTGLAFEVLCEGVGCPLGAGGRYDGPHEGFGGRAPAVGFAIGLDYLLFALSGRGND